MGRCSMCPGSISHQHQAIGQWSQTSSPHQPGACTSSLPHHCPVPSALGEIQGSRCSHVCRRSEARSSSHVLLTVVVGSSSSEEVDRTVRWASWYLTNPPLPIPFLPGLHFPKSSWSCRYASCSTKITGMISTRHAPSTPRTETEEDPSTTVGMPRTSEQQC